MTSSPPAKRFDWGNLRLRILSAAVLAPTAFGLLWIGGGAFLTLVAVACALLAVEWGKMATPESPGRTAGLVTLAVLVPLFLTYRQTVPMALLALPVSAVLAALIARLTGWSERSPDIAYGVLYLGLPGVALLWLREGVDGRGWALLLFAVTWSADVVAYAAGNVFKGPKLWPRFSPNKTWSGFCFGLAGSVAAALAASMIWAPEGGPGLRWAAAIGFTAGLATMAGDLWESMLKRRFGVKDSGDLIPGHGGLLDRVDGLMFAVLVVSAARLAIAASHHSQAVTQFR